MVNIDKEKVNYSINEAYNNQTDKVKELLDSAKKNLTEQKTCKNYSINKEKANKFHGVSRVVTKKKENENRIEDSINFKFDEMNEKLYINSKNLDYIFKNVAEKNIEEKELLEKISEKQANLDEVLKKNQIELESKFITLQNQLITSQENSVEKILNIKQDEEKIIEGQELIQEKLENQILQVKETVKEIQGKCNNKEDIINYSEKLEKDILQAQTEMGRQLLEININIEENLKKSQIESEKKIIKSQKKTQNKLLDTQTKTIEKILDVKQHEEKILEGQQLIKENLENQISQVIEVVKETQEKCNNKEDILNYSDKIDKHIFQVQEDIEKHLLEKQVYIEENLKSIQIEVQNKLLSSQELLMNIKQEIIQLYQKENKDSINYLLEERNQYLKELQEKDKEIRELNYKIYEYEQKLEKEIQKRERLSIFAPFFKKEAIEEEQVKYTSQILNYVY